MEKKVELCLDRFDDRQVLRINSESIEIAGYEIKSSADGNTELVVKIVGLATEFGLVTSLTR